MGSHCLVGNITEKICTFTDKNKVESANFCIIRPLIIKIFCYLQSSQTEHIHAVPAPNPQPLPEVPPPHATIDKPFLLSDGRVSLEASLDKAIYSHGEPVRVRVRVHNASGKTVRRIKVFVVQYVDVCMFSNGKFKNVVAMVRPKDDCPVCPGHSLDRTYTLQPSKGATKNWIALEDSYSKSGSALFY